MKIFIDNERSAIRRVRRSRRGRLFARSGFTLVELLTVIAIIGMLGAISITTVRAAIESARATQTRTTIAKIDNVLTSIYEKYQYRRVDVSGYDGVEVRAFARLLALRDLIRCDMPCCELEVNTPSRFNGGAKGRTPLQDSYYFAIQRAYEIKRAKGEDGSLGDGDLNPELLYLVLTNAAPECRSSFSERELADTDGDGLLEIVDGWGKPIRWLRWAPGINRSDRQPTIDFSVGGEERYAQIYGDVSNADPLDPLSVISRLGDAGILRQGWFLVPYVYSAGVDGEYGIRCNDVNDEAEYMEAVIQNVRFKDIPLMNDPFTSLDQRDKYWLGFPEENADGVNVYKDNIDNHKLIR